MILMQAMREEELEAITKATDILKARGGSLSVWIGTTRERTICYIQLYIRGGPRSHLKQRCSLAGHLGSWQGSRIFRLIKNTRIERERQHVLLH